MFFFSGLPTFDNDNPSLWVVAPAAAIAVCALVLPGVSGSFILVTLGLYQPTLQAVNDRDLGYLGVFCRGGRWWVSVDLCASSNISWKRFER